MNNTIVKPIVDLEKSPLLLDKILSSINLNINTVESVESFIFCQDLHKSKAVLLESDKKIEEMLILSSFKIDNVAKSKLDEVIDAVCDELGVSKECIVGNCISLESENITLWFKELSGGVFEFKLYVPKNLESNYVDLINKFKLFQN